MKSGRVRLRLCVMMFGQYVGIGAWAVPLATYLLTAPESGGLGFTAAQTSWIYSATALIGLFAPLLLGLLADRLFAAQKLLGLLHLVGAGILYLAGSVCANAQPRIAMAADPAAETTSTFFMLMALMLCNAVVVVLTLGLSNVTGFRNLKEPKKSFGGVRMYGTVAWIIINIAVDLLANPMSAQPLFIGAVCSVLMGLYSFTLPNTPPARIGKGWKHALGVPALNMFRDNGFRTVLLCAMCMAAVQQFYSIYCNPFLKDIGAAKPVALQTLAQTTEVVCMLAFPFALARFGVKCTLAIGIAGWIVRNALFASGSLPLIASVGLPLHGMCYTFFFIVANVYVDRHAPNHLRASAQGLFTFVSSGVGTLLGNFLAARVLNLAQSDAGIDWTWFWLTPAVCATIVWLLFLVFFHEDKTPVTVPT